MKELKNIINKNIEKIGMIIALVGIVIIFSFLTWGTLLTPLNVTNIIMQNSYVIILAIGMLLVILTGEIDLSGWFSCSICWSSIRDLDDQLESSYNSCCSDSIRDWGLDWSLAWFLDSLC
ncbi:hypothetical protein B795N_21530 [Marinilactibacillus psychrotolerans]|uniref:hypothetical protein n=1 Tax=Marinilactibacillus psychrotolerans TaxID=191770 RepID=UPI001C7D5A7A|nr:hypothetical protein [Marinilactibacillus psychrotolerans]GEQ34271.1 hypothetical protein B795N_21530 [Marinilactibacillus psychrotolerans]